MKSAVIAMAFHRSFVLYSLRWLLTMQLDLLIGDRDRFITDIEGSFLVRNNDTGFIL